MNPAEPISTWLFRIFSPLLYQLSYPATTQQHGAITVPQVALKRQALKNLQIKSTGISGRPKRHRAGPFTAACGSCNMLEVGSRRRPCGDGRDWLQGDHILGESRKTFRCGRSLGCEAHNPSEIEACLETPHVVSYLLNGLPGEDAGSAIHPLSILCYLPVKWKDVNNYKQPMQTLGVIQ